MTCGSIGSTFPLPSVQELSSWRTPWVTDILTGWSRPGPAAATNISTAAAPARSTIQTDLETFVAITNQAILTNWTPASFHLGIQYSRASNIWLRLLLDVRWSPS